MIPDSRTPSGLHVFRPPYRSCEPLDTSWRPEPVEPGGSVVWFMRSTAQVWDELSWVMDRPRSLPFLLVLPEPEEVPPLVPILRTIPDLRPRGVLPTAATGTMAALRTLLAAPPRSLPVAVVDYLEGVDLVQDVQTRERLTTLFTLAPRTRSIQALARGMAQSRRSLGRYFSERDLPVPSHWLQFARILHVAIQLQNTTTSINRVAGRFGYPDGFTFSNAMKRLTGYRPSFVREHLGWEWILAAWLREEGREQR